MMERRGYRMKHEREVKKGRRSGGRREETEDTEGKICWTERRRGTTRREVAGKRVTV